jgi:hypothetical protein
MVAVVDPLMSTDKNDENNSYRLCLITYLFRKINRIITSNSKLNVKIKDKSRNKDQETGEQETATH